MDILLKNGDHARDGRGLPRQLEGLSEYLQQALIRLSVRKGSLARDPDLGSELYRLATARTEWRDRLAMSYAQEALAPIRELTVLSARCGRAGADVLTVAVELAWGETGKAYVLEVQVT